MTGERLEPDDGDERKVGTIVREIPMARVHVLDREPVPAPADHPAHRDALVVPASPQDFGLEVAHTLDEALRRGRR